MVKVSATSYLPPYIPDIKGMIHMNKGIKLMATCMVAFALAFGVLAPAEETVADEDGMLLISPGPSAGDDGEMTILLDSTAVTSVSDSQYGENYVHWFSLAIVTLLVLAALGYLHIKAHKH